ncbi:hypothetical protein [Aeromicrobium sp. UC242_57]|uniref:hypothetical protein n=1 Tax=Aeromicrobium sp. UC242_57 TaxID=3374624 RepID=UPI00379442B1
MFTALVVATVPAPAQAGSSTGVTGVITVAGEPLKSVTVQLYRNIDSDPGGDGDDGVARLLKTVSSDKYGKYTLTGLTSKKDRKYGLETYHYFVLVTDRSGKTVRKSAPIAVKKRKVVTKNFRLQPAAVVTGTVTRSDGRSPEGLVVTAEDDYMPPDRGFNPQLRPNLTTTVKADGTFRLAGLQRGSYEGLSFSGGRYGAQCYDFATSALGPCSGSSTQRGFRLVAKQHLSLAPVVVTDLISALTGKVTDTSGHPLKGITVEYQAVVGGHLSQPVRTRSSGRYALTYARTGSLRRARA